LNGDGHLDLVLQNISGGAGVYLGVWHGLIHPPNQPR
jgi:hypothetical protein